MNFILTHTTEIMLPVLAFSGLVWLLMYNRKESHEAG